MGTVSQPEIGDTGGSNSIGLSVSQLPPHSHNGSTDMAGLHDHTGTTDFAGNHQHQYNIAAFSNIPLFDVTDTPVFYANATTEQFTSASGIHGHDFTTNDSGNHFQSFNTNNTGNGDPINITNAYYKLAFILKL